MYSDIFVCKIVRLINVIKEKHKKRQKEIKNNLSIAFLWRTV